MRAVLQRVSRASVTVDRETIGTIGKGFLVLVGFTHGDGVAQVQWMADKIVGLRLFQDEVGKMNRDLTEIGGALLVVSQFTLYGNVRKGRRPSFIDAAAPEEATALYDIFVEKLRALSVHVETGSFGAMMDVELVNDGPVTLILDR